MSAEMLNKIDGNKKIVIIANFATDRVNGAYNVIENIAIYTNKLGYTCELWGLSTETTLTKGLIKYLKLKIYNFGFVFREFSLQKSERKSGATDFRPSCGGQVDVPGGLTILLGATGLFNGVKQIGKPALEIRQGAWSTRFGMI